MSINSTTFPSVLTLADAIRLQNNYRPVSVLPNQTRIFENILYKQIAPYFQKTFSKYQTGFRKGFNPQHCLVSMIKNFRNSLDQGGKYTALFTDLPKVFDGLPFSLPMPRHRSRLSHVNVLLCHYGGQLKTPIKQEAGKKIDWKR